MRKAILAIALTGGMSWAQVEASESRVDSLLREASRAERAGEYHKAIDLCDSASSIAVELWGPESAITFFITEAQSAEKAGDYGTAKFSYRAAASLLSEQGSSDSAISLVAQFGKRCSQSGYLEHEAWAYRWMAVELLEADRTQEALRYRDTLEALAITFSKDSSTYWSSGLAWRVVGDLEKARDSLDRAVRAYKLGGENLEKAGEYGDAAYAYWKAADILVEAGKAIEANAL
ncbi:MAG: hypothetical protein ABIM46_08305, partial [candidate division WOR-3 bacterium]